MPGSPDPDAALIAFKEEVLQATALIGTQARVDLRGKAPISGFAAVTLARANLRSGRLDLMTSFLEQFALRWALHPAPEAPADDPMLGKVLESGWLPRNSNTYDGYGNASAFYLRAAIIHITLHRPGQLDAWVDSERLRAMSTMAKDRETFRLLETYRKKQAKRGSRRTAEA